MRNITNYEKGKSISVEGDGIKYSFESASFNIKLILNPDILLRINTRLELFLAREPASINYAETFRNHLNSGYLALGDYMWLNSWCYTNRWGAGRDAIHTLESDIFGFRLGKKVKGTIDRIPIYMTPQEIFNKFVEKAIENFKSP